MPLARHSLWRRRAKKNSEISDILQSHNRLSAGYLQKNAETSIYKKTEIGKAEMSLKNLITDGRMTRMA
jgi:hypothetical protein